MRHNMWLARAVKREMKIRGHDAKQKMKIVSRASHEKCEFSRSTMKKFPCSRVRETCRVINYLIGRRTIDHTFDLHRIFISIVAMNLKTFKKFGTEYSATDDQGLSSNYVMKFSHNFPYDCITIKWSKKIFLNANFSFKTVEVYQLMSLTFNHIFSYLLTVQINKSIKDHFFVIRSRFLCRDSCRVKTELTEVSENVFLNFSSREKFPLRRLKIKITKFTRRRVEFSHHLPRVSLRHPVGINLNLYRHVFVVKRSILMQFVASTWWSVIDRVRYNYERKFWKKFKL